MIKVLHVAGIYLPYVGGSSLRLRNLIESLAQSNCCRMFVLVPKKDIHGEKLYAGDVKGYEVINGVHIYRVDTISQVPMAVRRINRRHDIDILHAHNPRFALVSYLSFIRKPVFIEDHTLKELDWHKEFLTRILYAMAERLIVLSEKAKNDICGRYKCENAKVEVIINGIDLDMFAPGISTGNVRNKLGIGREVPVIGYCGSFCNFQGVHELVKSIPHILHEESECRFLLVGGGPDFEKVRGYVKRHRWSERVIFTGKIPPTMVPSYMNCMDIFVMARPSNTATESTIPLKLFEAMAMGKAIVASNVGGLSQILTDRRNAILVPPGDEKMLADGIVDVMRNERLRESICMNARREVKKAYSWIECSSRLRGLYEEVIGNRRQHATQVVRGT